MSEFDFYQQIISKHVDPSISIKNVHSVPGGCINSTVQVATDKGTFFTKVNRSTEKDLFEKEALGLSLLHSKSSVSVPQVLGKGELEGKVYLILEWIQNGHQNSHFWVDFGKALAAQHQVTSAKFGLDHDNHIGRLPQSNRFHESWHEFFIEERLRPQLKLAADQHLIDQTTRSQFESLYNKLEQLIPKESPTLLHGDLWSGNFTCGQQSKPYIFDPAVYYGHRETEMAFTTMFGGFDSLFYQAYNEELPLEVGFENRIDIHNLYPLLVHVNLFGPSYLSGIKTTLNRLV